MRSGLTSAVMLLLLAGLSSCKPDGSSQNTASPTLDHVLTSRTLRAAYINYPPSMVVDPNTKSKTGIMSDVAAAIAKAMNLTLTYVEETSFATMVDTVDSGRADIVVSGIWPSSTRALRADFSRVVYYSPVYAYVRSDDARFDSKLTTADTQAVRVATIDGELSSIVAQSDFHNATMQSLPQQTDVSQLLLQLTAHKADITFVEPAIADGFLAKNPGSIRRVADVAPVRIFPNTFLFRKGDAGLRDAINVAIVELTNAGRIAAIVKPYDPGSMRFTLPPPPVSP